MERQTFEKIRHEFIKLADIKVHPKVQRTLKPKWVDKIAAEFDPDGFGELSVVVQNHRDKVNYLVFDGQHRFLAALKALGSDQQKVPCAVYEDVAEEKLARTFLDHANTVSVSALDRWPIRILAQEETPLVIEKMLAKFNCRVGNTRSLGVIAAVSALESVYTRYGSDVLVKALTVLTEAYNRDPDSFEGTFLRAVGLLCYRFNGAINLDELSKKIAKSGGPGRLLGVARDYAKATEYSMDRALADRLLHIYNKSKIRNRVEWEIKKKEKKL